MSYNYVKYIIPRWPNKECKDYLSKNFDFNFLTKGTHQKQPTQLTCDRENN